MKKYNYTYMLNNKAVSRKDFEKSLSQDLVKIVDSVGFFNISMTDEKKVKSELRQMRANGRHYSLLTSNNHSYYIIKELIRG